MKNTLNIFCNKNIKNFLLSLLSDYELTIMKLDLIKDVSGLSYDKNNNDELKTERQ